MTTTVAPQIENSLFPVSFSINRLHEAASEIKKFQEKNPDAKILVVCDKPLTLKYMSFLCEREGLTMKIVKGDNRISKYDLLNGIKTANLTRFMRTDYKEKGFDLVVLIEAGQGHQKEKLERFLRMKIHKKLMWFIDECEVTACSGSSYLKKEGFVVQKEKEATNHWYQSYLGSYCGEEALEQ